MTQAEQAMAELDSFNRGTVEAVCRLRLAHGRPAFETDGEACCLADDLCVQGRITREEYMSVLNGDRGVVDRILAQAAPGQPIPPDKEPEEPPQGPHEA